VRKVEEYVEILQKERAFAAEPEAPQAAFVKGSNAAKERVSQSIAHEVARFPSQGKGPNQGWKVPLRNPAAVAESVIQTVDGKLKLLTAEGESVSGPVLEIGNTNSRYRFSIGAGNFMNEWNVHGPAHSPSNAQVHHLLPSPGRGHHRLPRPHRPPATPPISSPPSTGTNSKCKGEGGTVAMRLSASC